MKIKISKPLFAGVLLLFAVCGFFFSLWLIDNRLPGFERNGDIFVYENSTVDDVIEQAEKNLGLIHPSSLRRSFNSLHDKITIVPGKYHIDSIQPVVYLVRAVTHGWQNPIRIVIPAGIRSKEVLAEKISSQMMVTKEELLQAFPDDIFSCIIPDTYEMYWTQSPKSIMKRLTKEKRIFWTDERKALAEAQGLTPEQVTVLASIIAQETNRKDEYPKIASVYLNRLRKGMKLQACPTVCYIYDYSITRVLNRHIKNPSPYNTYVHYGLPPTPICLPGKAHINAVLHPDKNRYLYFCADSSFNGRNIFSVTYSEHMNNARKYHDALNERKAGHASTL